MDEHTPGPWELREGHAEVFGPAIYAPSSHDLNPLAAVDHIDGTEADARLIAAAPDLLAALEGLVGAGQSFNTETFRDPRKGDVWEVAARRFLDAFAPAVAAIAKAKGSETAAP